MTSKDPKKLLLFLSSHGGSIELARIGDWKEGNNRQESESLIELLFCSLEESV